MRNRLLTIVLALIMSSTAISVAQNSSFNFTLKGEIEGATTSDTLLFTPLNTDSVTGDELAFKVPLRRDGKFNYAGKADEVHLYKVTLLSNRELPKTQFSRLYAMVMINRSTINIEGRVDQMPYLLFSGGFYTQPLQESQRIDKEIRLKQDAIYTKIDEANLSGNDSLSMHYSNEYRNFTSSDATTSAMRKVDSLKKAYFNTLDNDYVAQQACAKAYSATAEQLFEVYERLSPSAKEGYYGRELLQIATLMRNLKIGGTAPEFSIVTPGGKSISLSELRGKYVLIYNYGMCPGSMSIDPHVAKFYNEHKDNLEVIGYTEFRKEVEAFAAQIEAAGGATTEVGGGTIDLGVSMKSMTNHPWSWDVNAQDGDNSTVKKLYQFGGLPYFIFISPEGKMLARGYFDAYDVAKKTLEQ